MKYLFPWQINLNSSMEEISRESITVAYGEPVHPIMQFDPSDSSYLYLMTSHQVRLLYRHTFSVPLGEYGGINSVLEMR